MGKKMPEKRNNIHDPSPSVTWENFDMDKFFKETDEVGKILEKRKKEDRIND